ncbi:Proton-dependent oligopeptide transporter family - like 10 [Theobroma cacao]|nr:Proton-dependent oligopeptide transporter family - like 10 [Theobroma cacao]
MKFKGDSMSGVMELSVDWRGRPCKANKHGGMTAAVFVLGLQAFEMMAIAAVGNNLITYVFNEMHFPLSKSANIVTNFIGTVFLLSLVGGFLSDSYLGSFWTMLIFGFVELSGFILLCIQAHLPQLRPPHCDMVSDGENCLEAKGSKALIFFLALYVVALGSGCLKPNIVSLGADQFRRGDTEQSRRLSTYFNIAYFAFCMGELIALTLLVWVQTHSGMDVGFGVSAAAMAMGMISLISGTLLYRNKPPRGSFCGCNNKKKANLPFKCTDAPWKPKPVGLIEFFYKQSLEGMQSFLTAMTYCSYSFGFYLSSILVSLVNRITSVSSHSGWLSDNDLNKDRLDLFYWMLAGLSLVNFFNYLFWSSYYSDNPSLSPPRQNDESPEQDLENRGRETLKHMNGCSWK